MFSDEFFIEYYIKFGSFSFFYRKRRIRVFIDLMFEIFKLEKWFVEDIYLLFYMIDKYCEELNKFEYR